MNLIATIRRAGPRRCMIVLMTAVFLLFQSYLAFIRPLHPLVQTPLHWVITLIVAFLFHPIYKRAPGAPGSWKDKLIVVDVAIILALVYCAYYFVSQHDRLTHRIAYLDPLYAIDYVTAVIAIVIILEAVRRVLGWNLVIFVAIFMAYFWLGKNLPGFLGHQGTTIARFTDLMVMGTEGIFGTTVAVSVNFICYFIIFGVLFADCGGGAVLTDIGFRASKGKVGGPAKAAVISSGLLGMCSGSATANVTTTGVVTIPMMKKAGYQPHEAGAIEAVASTGGQIMPPIMGTSAFIMAEIIGISYLTICVAAVTPAFSYYFSVFLLVTFLAKKNRATQLNEVIETQPILKNLYLLLPMLVLVYCVIRGYSLQRGALLGIGAVLLINLLRWKNGVGLRQLFELMISGVKNVASVVIPTSACGIVIGIITMSGLANRLSTLIEKAGGSSLLFALIIAMLGCMVLGMALPTLAAYLTANILFAAPLIRLGMTPLTANMFLFYFGIFAQITPPVCLASFAAAGIAGANSWKTGWCAFGYSMVAFLVPYVFAYKPALLIVQTSFWDSFNAIVILLIGSVFLASAVAGWMFVPLRRIHRGLIFLAAILTIVPETLSTLTGIGLGMAMIVLGFHEKKKVAAAELKAA